ncbi:Transcriptional regulator NanR [Streptomyces sp. RB5]|uniref:Transcriptional regulator NanR n=1 Tax=Streptomyces smaragdinus TaxID=2585196 RepID=A0A7K0CG87_9ACTN|nr:FCD domain-containing protein [Streptomyces smaragdinus]MQY11754.1 Transcriptional regulator NanR [Streptomyces smaragdinus]
MTNKEFLSDSHTGSRAVGVAQNIERRILDEGLSAGHRLGTKQSLRTQYDVAPATLNEALRLLSDRGLITVRPGVKGGIFVATPPALVRLGRKMLELSGDAVSVADCLVVRDTLEPRVVREAARFANAADIERLRATVDEMLQPDLAADAYMRANWKLHRDIAAIVPNQVLRHTYQSMLEFVESRLQRVAAVGERPLDTHTGALIHKQLVDAIAGRDEARLTRAIAAHFALMTPDGEAE